MKNKFDDCPYNCVNGEILDRALGTMIACPYCTEKKKKLASQGKVELETDEIGSLPTILGINNQYLSTKFVYDSVVPEGERLFLEEESVDRQRREAEELYLGFCVGQKADYSMCFGLGNKGKLDQFVYPMLAKSYISGMTVSKFISCMEYNRLLINMSNDLDDFLYSDVLFMLICDGSTKADIAAAKGLMQSRALKGKATIFVTTWSIEACSILLGSYDDLSYFMAKSVFISYKSSKGKKPSAYINNLTGVTNASAEPSNNSVSLADIL